MLWLSYNFFYCYGKNLMIAVIIFYFDIKDTNQLYNPSKGLDITIDT